jgi:hypothetical protein
MTASTCRRFFQEPGLRKKKNGKTAVNLLCIAVRQWVGLLLSKGRQSFTNACIPGCENGDFFLAFVDFDGFWSSFRNYNSFIITPYAAMIFPRYDREVFFSFQQRRS